MMLLIADENSDTLDQLRALLSGSEHEAYFASDGEEALKHFRDFQPDAVLSALTLPKLGGLELLKEVRSLNPRIPFVMIGRTSEPESILNALRLGACDFLTRPLKGLEFQRTLKRIHTLRRTPTALDFPFEHLVQESRTLEFGNEFESLPEIVAFITRDVDSYGVISPEDAYLLNLFLTEALENAIFHGNLELDRSWREDPQAMYEEAIRRREQEVYAERRVSISYDLSRNSNKFVIRDEGKGFAHTELPDFSDPENLFKPNGKGLVLLANFMDEVFWNERGNEVTLIRYRRRKA